MESIYKQKPPLLKNNYSEDDSSSKREKKFPKIKEIDPDEKKKKQTKDDLSPLFFVPLEKVDLLSFEKIDGSIKYLEEISSPIIQEIISIKKNGIIKAAFTVKTKFFDSVEIHITLYDTNPYSYHIRLMGNEKLMQICIEQQSILSNQIKSAVSGINVHIATPRLRKKDRFSSKKEKKSIEKSNANCYGAIERE